MGIFSKLFSGRDERLAANKYSEHVQLGRDAAFQKLDQGMGEARGLYDQALSGLAPLGEEAGRGFSAYGDAAGINGPEGQIRAREAFRADPGYQFQQDEAARAGLRAASAGGMLASGNTLAALSDRAQGIADTSYGNYVSRLSPYLSLAPQNAGQQATLLSDLGGKYLDTARQKAGIEYNLGDLLGNSAAFGLTAGNRAASRGLGAVLGGVNALSSLAGSFAGGGL